MMAATVTLGFQRVSMGWIIDDRLDSGTILGMFQSKAGVVFAAYEPLAMRGARIFSFQKQGCLCQSFRDIG